MPRFHISTEFSFASDADKGRYVIRRSDNDYCLPSDPEVWSRPYIEDEDCGEYSYPADVRAKYEELTGKPEFDPAWDGSRMVNLVELISEEGGHDQPCRWGNRCDDHAVYCTNDGWLYSPRKCRRTWYTGGEIRDEDCPGYAPNPAFKKDN